MSIIIRNETPADYRAVENLTRESFWNVYRPGCTEHYVLHCYRSAPDFVPELDFVMEKDGELMGHVMYSRSEITTSGGKAIPIMTFGPISIAPGYKRQGYGKRLLDYSMEKARDMGAKALAITGNIDFYGKSGFVVASTKGIRYADADPDDTVVPYFLIKELETGFDTESPCLAAFRQYGNIDRLTRDILIEFIDTIYIYEGGRISIKFRFADEFRKIQEYIELNSTKTTEQTVAFN